MIPESAPTYFEKKEYFCCDSVGRVEGKNQYPALIKKRLAVG